MQLMGHHFMEEKGKKERKKRKKQCTCLFTTLYKNLNHQSFSLILILRIVFGSGDDSWKQYKLLHNYKEMSEEVP